MLQRMLFVSLTTLAFSACAQGGAGLPEGNTEDAHVRMDGSIPHDAGSSANTDASTDAGNVRNDSGPPGHDAGRISCGPGQHACGAGCVDDLPNEPAHGCRLGCGEPCAVPTGGVGTCTTSGTCDFTCEPPFSRVADTCTCVPRTCAEANATCGAPDDGCGRPLNCGSCGGNACVEGRCACDPDAEEPNDDGLTPPRLDELTDAPDSSGVYDDMNLHSAEDIDWVYFGISDSFDLGNPDITVTLDQIPAGSTYELSAFYRCSNNMSGTTCTGGTAINDPGPGCSTAVSSTGQLRLATRCGGVTTDSDGSLFVRVRSTTWSGLCNPYRLRVDVR